MRVKRNEKKFRLISPSCMLLSSYPFTDLPCGRIMSLADSLLESNLISQGLNTTQIYLLLTAQATATLVGAQVVKTALDSHRGPRPVPSGGSLLLGPHRYLYSFLNCGRVWKIMHGRFLRTRINWSSLLGPTYCWLKFSHKANREIQCIYIFKGKKGDTTVND